MTRKPTTRKPTRKTRKPERTERQCWLQASTPDALLYGTLQMLQTPRMADRWYLKVTLAGHDMVLTSGSYASTTAAYFAVQTLLLGTNWQHKAQ